MMVFVRQYKKHRIHYDKEEKVFWTQTKDVRIEQKTEENLVAEIDDLKSKEERAAEEAKKKRELAKRRERLHYFRAYLEKKELKRVVRAAGELSNPVHLIFKNNKVLLRGMCPANVAYYSVEAQASLINDAEIIVNPKDLLTAIDTLAGEQVGLKLTNLEKENPNLVVFEYRKEDYTPNIDTEQVDEPTIVTIPTEDFAMSPYNLRKDTLKSIKEAYDGLKLWSRAELEKKEFRHHVRQYFSEESVRFSVSHNRKSHDGLESFAEDAVGNSVRMVRGKALGQSACKYSKDYLKKFLKHLNSKETITLRWDDDKPLIVEQGRSVFILAPRVDRE